MIISLGFWYFFAASLSWCRDKKRKIDEDPICRRGKSGDQTISQLKEIMFQLAKQKNKKNLACSSLLNVKISCYVGGSKDGPLNLHLIMIILSLLVDGENNL